MVTTVESGALVVRSLALVGYEYEYEYEAGSGRRGAWPRGSADGCMTR
jgi:hypothetical protein